MQCDYLDAGRCGSCTLMGTPYPAQLAGKQARVQGVLAEHVGPGLWAPPAPSRESGFRNRAKLAVGGRAGDPTLGILDGRWQGVDLERCGLYEPGLAEAVPVLSDLVAWLGLEPYDVGSRAGEIRYVLATHSPDGELMVRFVLRSGRHVDTLREALPALQRELPGAVVVTANIHPEPVASLEGDTELVLTERTSLPMRLNGIVLHLRPRSFFQTNTQVAAELYRQAREWAPASGTVWDLYCGVGPFALHLAAPGREVVGVEISQEAVHSARRSSPAVPGPTRFVAGDATELAASGGLGPDPEVVVVNPPRRGIGERLAAWLEQSGASTCLYSSCNALSLARDLALLPSWRVEAARLLDMFPQSEHHEVLVRLGRV